MPLRVALKKHFFARSERVKSVDFHPTEPFLLSALYDGRLHVHDYLTHALLKEIDASPLPLRTAKFVVKRQWILCGGDDCALRVFNLHTLEKVKEIPNAHTDYIRHVSIHPTKPLVLSSSDDMTIKLWDYDRNWQRLASYEQHTYYVMQTQWHPRDPNLFASCSLDRTIKVWGLLQLQQQQPQSGSGGGGSSGTSTGAAAAAPAQQQQPAATGQTQHGGVVVSAPHFTLTGHERGINCIEYSRSGERPYIVSGSDDCTVRVWDYQTKQCIQVLTGHTRNVCAVLFTTLTGHTLPLLFSAGEDTQLFVWHALTYKKETSVDLNVERIWSLSLLDTTTAAAAGAGIVAAGTAAGGSAAAAGGGSGGGLGGLVLAVGSDSGTLVLKMGKEMLVASLHAGKAVVARGFEILQANLRLIEDQQWLDGERLPIAYKELGQCDLFPQSISHHPSGRFIAVCGDGEYVIYTAQTLRNKKFGKCMDFVWAADGRYAIREESGRVRVYTHFEETFNFAPPFQTDALYGGHLLALKAADDSFLCFYDWESCRLVRRIDVVGVQQVLWSSSGFFVALLTLDRIYILHHDKYAVMAAQAGQAREEEAGIEIAFELADQIPEAAGSGIWASECLVYSSGPSGRIKCWCAGHLEVVLYGAAATGTSRAVTTSSILGYVPEQGKVYMIDRDLALSAFSLNAAYLDYKVAIGRKDVDGATALLPRVPEELHDRLARFLLFQGMKEEALRLAKDEQLRFEVALSLGRLQLVSECAEITRVSSKTAAEPSAVTTRLKLLGDVALEAGNFSLAASCFKDCGDLHSLLLLYSASGDEKQLLAVAAAATAAQNYNVAFLAYALTHRIDSCVDVLCVAGRFPEAALFARSYAPSRMSHCVQLWRRSLSSSSSSSSSSAAKKIEGKGQSTMGGGNEMRGPADPATAPEKFAHYTVALQAEKLVRERYARVVPASSYQTLRHLIDLDIIDDINKRGVQQVREDLLSHTMEDLLAEDASPQQQIEEQSAPPSVTDKSSLSSMSKPPHTSTAADLGAAVEEQRQQQQRQEEELNGISSRPNTDALSEDTCPSSAGALHHRLLAERQQQLQQRGVAESEGGSSSLAASCGSPRMELKSSSADGTPPSSGSMYRGEAGGGVDMLSAAAAAAGGNIIGGGGPATHVCVSSDETAPAGSAGGERVGGGAPRGVGAERGVVLDAGGGERSSLYMMTPPTGQQQQGGLNAGILLQHQLLHQQDILPGQGGGGGRALLSSSCRSVFSSSDGARSTYTERDAYTTVGGGVGLATAGGGWASGTLSHAPEGEAAVMAARGVTGAGAEEERGGRGGGGEGTGKASSSTEEEERVGRVTLTSAINSVAGGDVLTGLREAGAAEASTTAGGLNTVAPAALLGGGGGLSAPGTALLIEERNRMGETVDASSGAPADSIFAYGRDTSMRGRGQGIISVSTEEEVGIVGGDTSQIVFNNSTKREEERMTILASESSSNTMENVLAMASTTTMTTTTTTSKTASVVAGEAVAVEQIAVASGGGGGGASVLYGNPTERNDNTLLPGGAGLLPMTEKAGVVSTLPLLQQPKTIAAAAESKNGASPRIRGSVVSPGSDAADRGFASSTAAATAKGAGAAAGGAGAGEAAGGAGAESFSSPLAASGAAAGILLPSTTTTGGGGISAKVKEDISVTYLTEGAAESVIGQPHTAETALHHQLQQQQLQQLQQQQQQQAPLVQQGQQQVSGGGGIGGERQGVYGSSSGGGLGAQGSTAESQSFPYNTQSGGEMDIGTSSVRAWLQHQQQHRQQQIASSSSSPLSNAPEASSVAVDLFPPGDSFTGYSPALGMQQQPQQQQQHSLQQQQQEQNQREKRQTAEEEASNVLDTPPWGDVDPLAQQQASATATASDTLHHHRFTGGRIAEAADVDDEAFKELD